MNADRLLALYENVAEAPDAVPRLRRFVLDLAVRGKLVPQDPGDEPASELLKRIAAEKARLVKAGEIKKSKPVSLFDDVAAEIPSNWALVPLGEVILQHLGGGTPSKSNENYWNGELRWASVKDVGKSKYLDDTIDRITEAGLANSSSNLIEPGNLLVVTRMGLGKVSINRIPVAINQDLRALFLSQHVSIDYAYIFFLTHGFQGTGLTVKGIKLDELLRIPFPLPPLAEQHRIVAKVDDLMALLDRLEAARTAREATRDRLTAASLARLTAPAADPAEFPANARFALATLPALTARPDQVKPLRQTILNLAVRGKLVEQDPADEPASELLKRIAAERARMVKAGEIRKRIPFEQVEEPPFGAPPSWEWVRLGELGTTQTGSTPPKSKPEHYGSDVPFVRPGDLYPDRVEYPGEGLSKSGVSASGRLVPTGSILMVCIGTIGKCQIVDRSVSFNQQINTLTAFSFVVPRFVLLAMQSDFFQQAAWAASARTTIAILNKGKWEKLPVPLPPLAEQHRIVAMVDALMALCDRLEAALITADTTRARLLEALLHEALAPAEETEAVA